MKPVPLFGSETIGATVSVGRARGKETEKTKKKQHTRGRRRWFCSSLTSSHRLLGQINITSHRLRE